ncbi:MAG: SAM-dependent methyltransferase [Methylophaga sp.]|nr:MAG: SAM-dependent methyltransferase [Methylophaga sp.]
MTLAKPDDIAQRHSEQLLSLIYDEIERAGGKISFADYMHLCLYAPGLGYYSAGSQKLGQHGDFTTAPEISPLFSRTFAHHIKDVLSQLKQPSILEFGAGSGKMAADILAELTAANCYPEKYYIIEVSADLRERQYKTIAHALPDIVENVVWLDAIPNCFVGVILANEVCDAMPVHMLHFKQGKVAERYIEKNDAGLCWCEGSLSQSSLASHIIEIQALIGESEDYITEVNLAAQAWLCSLADNLQQGALFICDYGYPKADYYHPQRNEGTLMCYYQHQGHADPLILPSLQDITAHVDFTLLAQTAIDNGLEVNGFQSQADFLLAGGITELSQAQENDPLLMLQQASEIKQLTLPSAMGENFKVLTLSKSLNQLLPRCQLADRRYTL